MSSRICIQRMLKFICIRLYDGPFRCRYQLTSYKICTTTSEEVGEAMFAVISIVTLAAINVLIRARDLTKREIKITEANRIKRIWWIAETNISNSFRFDNATKIARTASTWKILGYQVSISSIAVTNIRLLLPYFHFHVRFRERERTFDNVCRSI